MIVGVPGGDASRMRPASTGMSEPQRSDSPLAYNLRDAASAMQLHTETVRRLLVSGELKGRKAGRAWRVSPDAIRAWLLGEAI